MDWLYEICVGPGGIPTPMLVRRDETKTIPYDVSALRVRIRDQWYPCFRVHGWLEYQIGAVRLAVPAGSMVDAP